jgi:predicted MPP superfamily phosphohydrolase
MDGQLGSCSSRAPVDNSAVEIPQEFCEFHPPRMPWLRVWPWVRRALNHIGAAGMFLATGGHTWLRAPFQIEYTQVDLPLTNLPASLEGFRMVQITDLHTGRSTPVWFLEQVIERVNQMKPDLVVVTGDIISRRGKWIPTACELLAKLKAPTVATLGNHDYTEGREPWHGHELADRLEKSLEDKGIRVLRNEAMPIERADGRAWIIGLEDFWSLKFSAEQALAGVNCDEPIIALSHNPDTIYALARANVQWVIAGHTHGGQIRIPLLGGVVMPMRHKQFAMGHHRVGGTRMYVSRGVGFKVRARFRCPPEVTTFILRRT